MAVDKGAPGAASRYYGAGQSEQRQRDSQDLNQLRNAFHEGKQAGFQESKEAARGDYNQGLGAQAAELQAASMWRGRASRKTGRAQGRI